MKTGGISVQFRTLCILAIAAITICAQQCRGSLSTDGEFVASGQLAVRRLRVPDHDYYVISSDTLLELYTGSAGWRCTTSNISNGDAHVLGRLASLMTRVCPAHSGRWPIPSPDGEWVAWVACANDLFQVVSASSDGMSEVIRPIRPTPVQIFWFADCKHFACVTASAVIPAIQYADVEIYDVSSLQAERQYRIPDDVIFDVNIPFFEDPGLLAVTEGARFFVRTLNKDGYPGEQRTYNFSIFTGGLAFGNQKFARFQTSEGGTVLPPVISATGQRIAWPVKRGNAVEIWVTDDEGHHPRLIGSATGRVPLNRISWLRGDRSLVFQCGSTVCIVELDQKN